MRAHTNVAVTPLTPLFSVAKAQPFDTPRVAEYCPTWATWRRAAFALGYHDADKLGRRPNRSIILWALAVEAGEEAAPSFEWLEERDVRDCPAAEYEDAMVAYHLGRLVGIEDVRRVERDTRQ